MDKTIDYYISLPYTIELKEDPEAGWFVKVKELPGCMSQGESAEEALEMIREAMELWLEVALEDGDPIPEPRDLDDYSGKFVVRVPRSLHRHLVERARCEGVSLNQYANLALAQATSQPVPEPVETTETLHWPGLKASVRQVLLAAGLKEEAGELDETQFSIYFENQLLQVEAALQSTLRGYGDALQYARAMAYMLEPVAPQSPVLDILLRTVQLLRDQIEQVCELRQGIVDQATQQYRVRQMVLHSRAADRVREILPPYPLEFCPPEESRPSIDWLERSGVSQKIRGGTGE